MHAVDGGGGLEFVVQSTEGRSCQIEFAIFREKKEKRDFLLII